jgi:hypothetical protein
MLNNRCRFIDAAWMSRWPQEELDMPGPAPVPDNLADTEWSPEFETLMRNRLVMGAFRYGLLKAPGKPQWNRTKSIARRLAAYDQDGNREHLVDVANMALLEFEEGPHRHRPIHAQDDGEHAERAGG